MVKKGSSDDKSQSLKLNKVKESATSKAGREFSTKPPKKSGGGKKG